MRVPMRPSYHLLFQEILVQEGTASLYDFFWEKMGFIFRCFALLGSDVGQEKKLIFGRTSLNALGLGPFFCELVLVGVGITEPVNLSVDIPRHRASKSDNIKPFSQLHPAVVDIEEAIVFSLAGEELLAVMVSRDKKHLALEYFLEDRMNRQSLFHHFVFIMGVFVMVALGSISSNEAVIETGLVVIMFVSPHPQSFQPLVVEVDVGDEGYLQFVYFLQHQIEQFMK